jgi:hypothetical protein
VTKQHPPNSLTDQQQEQSVQSSGKGVRNIHTYALAGSIALFAFVLFLVSIIISMQGKTHQTADRARLEVHEATIVGPLIQHNVPTATILLKNTGHSPALTTKIRLVMTVWTSNKLPDWDMPLKLTTDAETIREIGGGSIVPQTVSLIAPLTDVQGMHLERKDWLIVILGIVSYIDIFSNPHETKLCLIWRDTSTQHLNRCEKWNEAD